MKDIQTKSNTTEIFANTKHKALVFTVSILI